MVFVVRRSFAALDSSAIAARRAAFAERGRLRAEAEAVKNIADPFLKLRAEQEVNREIERFRK